MVTIKKFIDRVSAMDGKQGRDVVLPAQEARLLRDEIAKLLADRTQEAINKQPETIEVQVSGGRW